MALVDEHFGEWEEFDEPKQKNSSSFFPVPAERIPLKHRGHRYHIWENDAYGNPILVAEFTAKDDRTARRMMPEIIAGRLNETTPEARATMKYLRKDLTLWNIDTLKKVPLKQKSLLFREWSKLRKLF